MKTFTIRLNEEYGFLQGGELDALLMEYPYDGENTIGWKRPAVIVVPGGGYAMASAREGDPVASEFFVRGFQAFVLRYLNEPQGVRYPEQLLELSAAVDYVKKNAEAFDVNKDEVFVVGFSAGGHLTGNLAVEYQDVPKKAGTALDCKPTAVGLCYPVITSDHGHFASYVNLLNGYTEEAKQELYKTLNLDEAVSEQTPPAFIWATAEDQTVPPDNAIRYALALDRKGISYELHIYPHGVHGLSVANAEINPQSASLKKASRWMSDCADFFREFVKESF